MKGSGKLGMLVPTKLEVRILPSFENHSKDATNLLRKMAPPSPALSWGRARVRILSSMNEENVAFIYSGVLSRHKEE
jgi:hypothetical protein